MPDDSVTCGSRPSMNFEPGPSEHPSQTSTQKQAGPEKASTPTVPGEAENIRHGDPEVPNLLPPETIDAEMPGRQAQQVDDFELRTAELHIKSLAQIQNGLVTRAERMVEQWNKQIDLYLLFAGLYSGILTAFNVQSYQLLQQAAPHPGAVVGSQAQSFAMIPPGHPFIDSKNPISSITPTLPNVPSPPRYAIWLNIVWFSSLIVSLTSVVIGIIIKQCLGEYSRDFREIIEELDALDSESLSGRIRRLKRVTQHGRHLDRSRPDILRNSHTAEIILIIPTLLFLSLALFLSGILVLLWALNFTVAVVISVLVVILASSTVYAIFFFRGIIPDLFRFTRFSIRGLART